jgi:hypothetical protein
MKRISSIVVIIGMLFSVNGAVAQEQGQEAVEEQVEKAAGRVLVIEEAQERNKSAVAVKVYLIDDILEATIIGLMYATKPRIYKAIVVGPKLGTLSPQERQTLYPRAEDEELFYKTKDVEAGLIRLSKREKKKKLEGTLTKELARFKIPKDKIVTKKRYQLRVQVESMQRGGQLEKYRFDLKDLPQLILQ